MPLATHTLSGDLSALIGERDKVSATIHLNTEDGNWVNETDGTIILGSGRLYYTRNGGTGEFTVTLPTSTGTGLQYEVRIDYTDETNKQKPQQSWRSGWFTLTANSDLAERAANSTVYVSQSKTAEFDSRLDALEANSGVSDALDTLATQVNGYTSLGNVSGAITVQPVGTQVMNVTGPTTIAIAGGHANGESFTLLIRSGGDDVTWASSIGFDAGDPTGDVISVTFLKVEGYWTSLSSAGGAGEVVVPVTDPPTQPGAITVDPTADGYNLSWVASTVAAGYEVQIDGGTWVDSGANLTHAHTDLDPGSSHSGAVRAYNSLGTRSTSRAWGPASVDTMTPHAYFLSLNPEVYLRTSQGAHEDFSRTPGTWAARPSLTGGTFDGPALLDGDLSSLRMAPGSGLQRPIDDLMIGATSYTGIVVMKAAAGSTGGANGMAVGEKAGIASGRWETENYQQAQPGGLHTFFFISPGGSSNTHLYVDGGTDSWITGGPPPNPIPAPVDAPVLFVHGGYYGGSDLDGGYIAYMVVLKNTVLDLAQRQAICAITGTLGNPAGGA